MEQEFVTLPREVVEQALEALNVATTPLARDRQEVLKAMEALRAALEQPQIQSGGIPPNWKLVPVEPTEEMLRSSCGCESPAMFRESLRRETDGRLTAEMVEKIIRRHLASYRAMLDAAPQPPVVDQPQGEQEPYGYVYGNSFWEAKNPRITDDVRRLGKPLYTHPQPKRQPLTNEQIKAGLIHSIEYTDAREGCAFNIGVRFAERAHGIK